MALGEWLRQVMVETSALKHRAESVARLMASRQLVALKLSGASHQMLLVERDSLRADFQFLAGARAKETVLFRGNAVDLVMERRKLQAIAETSDVVAAPWKFLGEPADALQWFPFLDASLKVAPSLDAQLENVPHRKQIARVAENPAFVLRVSRAQRDYHRFWDGLEVPGGDERDALEAGFRDGGAVCLVFARGGRRLLAGALLLIRRRGAVVWDRSGFVDAKERAGRMAALELAVLRHALELGVAQVDFGMTPSVVNHPLFRMRRALGCAFAPTPSSPALMLTVAEWLRPMLFAKSPLLTGDVGDFTVQLGCAGVKEKALRAQAHDFDVPGCRAVALAGDFSGLAERVLREEVPRLTFTR